MASSSSMETDSFKSQDDQKASPISYMASSGKNLVDDDGPEKRTGTWKTTSAHIITAVIASGVLSSAWAIAQLGWAAGPLLVMAFSFITYFTSSLLADCYKSPDPVTGKGNNTYMDLVRANVGKTIQPIMKATITMIFFLLLMMILPPVLDAERAPVPPYGPSPCTRIPKGARCDGKHG